MNDHHPVGNNGVKSCLLVLHITKARCAILPEMTVLQGKCEFWIKVFVNLGSNYGTGQFHPWDDQPWIIPWICYERSFNEFCLSIWNQLVFNQRLQLFVQSPQPYLLILVDQLSVLITSRDITKWCSINLLWKKVNGTHEWAHRPYQLLSTRYHCCLYKHRWQDERQPLQSSWPVLICT